MSIVKYVVTLRETHEVAIVVDFDTEWDDPSVEEAKRRAVEDITSGDGERRRVVDVSLEAETAWFMGAKCILVPRNGYLVCDLHFSSARPGEDRCFTVKEIEAQVA